MSTISAPTSSDGAIAAGVIYNASIKIEALGFSVCAKVFQELAYCLNRLLGPATECVLEGLALCMTANTSRVDSVRDDLFVLKTVFHVLDSLIDFEPLDGSCHIVCVLEVRPQVTDFGFGGFCGFGGLSGVLNHCKSKPIY